MLGIGGGGDVVGALAVARLCEALGTPFELGGVAWERIVIDPKPGPRALAEVANARLLAPTAALASPDTATADGVPFSEARMATVLGSETVLIDVTQGSPGVASGLLAAAGALDCDLIVCVDVGGDILARGDEPGLASPLCDAVMLAGAALAAAELPVIGAVFGPGCDGELAAEEVVDRVAALARAGAWLGAWGLTARIADELADAAATVPTEASLMAVRCARGEVGTTAIRAGRRIVKLSPLGALTLFFDPVLALATGLTPLAVAVRDATDIEEAREALAALGVRTELDYERSRAGEGPAEVGGAPR